MSLLQTIKSLRPARRRKASPTAEGGRVKARLEAESGHLSTNRHPLQSRPCSDTGAGCLPQEATSTGAKAARGECLCAQAHPAAAASALVKPIRSSSPQAQDASHWPSSARPADDNSPSLQPTYSSISFYSNTQARTTAVDLKIQAYLRGAEQILRSNDAGYAMRSFPLQEPAFRFADQLPAASCLR